MIPNKENGQIVLTKTISAGLKIGEFVAKVVQLIGVIPGIIRVDAQGFVGKNTDLVFQWAAPNSGMILANEKFKFLIDSGHDARELANYFKSMENTQFQQNWFDRHDSISDLQSSGLHLKRLTNIVIFYNPYSHDVRDFMKYF